MEFDKISHRGIEKYPHVIGDALDNFKFREALSEMMNLARLGNKYLTDTEPWKIFKTDENRVKTISIFPCKFVRTSYCFLRPFLPFTAEKLRKMMNLEKLSWDAAGIRMLIPGHRLNKPGFLFRKIRGCNGGSTGAETTGYQKAK